MRGVDLRQVGSRNVGATNAFRELGRGWGALVFLMDVLKGAAAVWVARWIVGEALGPALVAGVAAILGHVFSPWLRFKGGRGVATSLGVFLAIMPVPSLLAFGVWAALVGISKRVSVGSIGAALAYPFLVLLLPPTGLPRQILVPVAAAVSLLVILRHTANIRRLLAGTEPPIVGAKEPHS
jgi:glycerol-3-phosphate acyltransferase PlsY